MNIGDALLPDAVEANQAGRLTDGQLKAWRSDSRGLRKTELYFAVVLTVLGVLVWFAPGPAKDAVWKPIAGVGFLVVAAFLLWRGVSGTDPLTEDVRAGEARSIDGAITKRSVTTHSRSGSHSTSTTTYYFDVADQRYEVARVWYEQAPDAGYVRLFYLPRSRRVVNLLILQPPAVELPQTMESSQQVALDMLKGMFTRDEEKRAEVRAQGAAMAQQMQHQMAQAAVAPPPEQRDARPLAEAIVGTWSGPFATVSFDPSGTVTATLMGGRQESGHWSVDAQGRLVSDAMGGAGATDAWVKGDELTITVNGMGLTFTRAASA